MPLQGAKDMVLLLGAIVGCHCSVVWLGGRVMTNFGEVDVVLLLGAIAGCNCRVLQGRVTTNFGEWTWCNCWVPLQGTREEGDDQFCGSGCGAIVGCHCSV